MSNAIISIFCIILTINPFNYSIKISMIFVIFCHGSIEGLTILIVSP